MASVVWFWFLAGSGSCSQLLGPLVLNIQKTIPELQPELGTKLKLDPAPTPSSYKFQFLKF